MLNSPIFIAIFWPFAFAILQTLMNRLVSDTREGERKFRVWYRAEGDKYSKESPLNLHELKTKLYRKTSPVSDVDELQPGFAETSFGTDLCVGAISTDLVNMLVLANKPIDSLTAKLLYLAPLALIAEFVIAIAIVTFLRQVSNHDKVRTRVFFVQITNFAGLVAMFLSFFILGRLLHG